MIKLLNGWFNRNFSDPQVVILAFLLFVGIAIVYFIGDILTPLFAALIIAYILDGSVAALIKLKIPRLIGSGLVFSVFILLLTGAIFWLAPLMIRQATQLVVLIPKMMAQGQTLLMQLPSKYPHIISQEQILDLIRNIQAQTAVFSQHVVSFSLSSVADLLSFMVYLIMVPLLVFFFLMDKNKMLTWAKRFLPHDSGLVTIVWTEVNQKIAGYMRGKLVEILIIWAVSLVTFLWLGLDYAMLLSFMVGISVLIPYVGAAVVTLPILVVAYFQWGYGSELIYVLSAYAVIQFLDGNLLVPLLFSEMVNLHPAAIIAAVLIFGGLWGLWGVFFAIPLATLVNAVMNAWPETSQLRHEKINESHE